MEAQCGDEEYAPPQELHRFLVHCRDGGRLETLAQKRSAGFLLGRIPTLPGQHETFCWTSTY